MSDELRSAIASLAIPVDGEAIASALALRDQLDARVAEAVAAFDAQSQWDAEGATSMTAWLRDRAGRTRREAVHITSRAKALRSLPVTAAAWSDGTLGSGQVDGILARLDHLTRARFAEHENALVPALARLSVADTARAMSIWAARADAETHREDPPEPERMLHASTTLGGRLVLDGELDPTSGEVVKTALRLATEPAEAEDPRPPSTRRADALVDICRFFLDHQSAHRGRRHRPHVNVVVDLAALEAGRGGRTVDGEPIDAGELGALLCDCALHRLLVAGRSSILDYGTTVRTIPANLWNALVIRDEHCRWPGCDRPSQWCDGHHVVAFPTGPTSLDNLALLCRRHHRRLHRRDWHAKLLPDATLEVIDPHGTVRTSHPPAAIAAETAFW